MSVVNMVICDYCQREIERSQDSALVQLDTGTVYHYHKGPRPCWTIIARLLLNARQYEGVEPDGRRVGADGGGSRAGV